MERVMILKELYGKLDSGEEVHLCTLTNKSGMKAKIINYGAVNEKIKDYNSIDILSSI